MEIIEIINEDMLVHGKETTCIVHTILVKVMDIDIFAKEMIELISDTSWINSLDAVGQRSYSARAQRTIEKLVNEIFQKVETEMSTEFGEYMVSCTAQQVLSQEMTHISVPLAELWKEKVSGNPGFDFHTESASNLIAFGEAKYSGVVNPYTNAFEQILEFISLEKDYAELVDLEKFVSSNAINRHLNDGHRAFVAAFSINSLNPKTILSNALNSEIINDLLKYPELYLIGIQVS